MKTEMTLLFANARASATSSASTLVLGLMLGLLVACATPEPTAEQGSAEQASEKEDASQARIYTVRGVVRGVPTTERPGSQLTIRHQTIPDFIDLKGNEVGMDSMTMPFPTAKDLSLDSITPGDTIEFDLAVDWDADHPVQVTKITKLPEGTEVEFGEREEISEP